MFFGGDFMKKTAFMLSVILLISMILSGTAYAAQTVASGTSADGLKWTLDSNGLLTISGQGPMTDNVWLDYNTSIKKWSLSPVLPAFASPPSSIAQSLQPSPWPAR